jgi:acrylyl-CoA reductase (NADPH)
MIPGIDLAGIVEQSNSPTFAVGDKVLTNGWGLGETRWGGLAAKARVKAEWLVPLPAEFTSYDAMAIGTAGYTAMLCLMALAEQGVRPEQGEVIVSGATGGVGSIATLLLVKRGYRVVALTGRPAEHEYLRRLGASEVLDSTEFATKGKPLLRERWAGAVDTTGGPILANICAGLRYGGTIAACGLAQSMDFPATVAPFILRGVTLVGIDSVYAKIERRRIAWEKLAAELDPQSLAQMTRTVGLQGALEGATLLLDRKLRGRIVVDVGA